MFGKKVVLAAVLGMAITSGARAASLFDLKGSPDVSALIFGTYNPTTKELNVSGITEQIDGTDLVDMGSYTLDVFLTATPTGTIDAEGGPLGGDDQTFFSSSTIKAIEIDSTQVAIEFSSNAGTIATGKDFLTLIDFGGTSDMWQRILDVNGVSVDNAPALSVPAPKSLSSGLGFLALVAGATAVRRRTKMA